MPPAGPKEADAAAPAPGAHGPGRSSNTGNRHRPKPPTARPPCASRDTPGNTPSGNPWGRTRSPHRARDPQPQPGHLTASHENYGQLNHSRRDPPAPRRTRERTPSDASARARVFRPPGAQEPGPRPQSGGDTEYQIRRGRPASAGVGLSGSNEDNCFHRTPRLGGGPRSLDRA